MASTRKTTGQVRRRDGARPTSRSAGLWWWWPALGVWVAALAGGSYLQRLPLWAFGALLAINGVTFFTYLRDKSAAQRNAQRTPEKTLHLLSLAGGWPGARAAQQLFRHKSSKQSFQSGYALTVFVHLAALLAWLYWGPGLFIA